MNLVFRLFQILSVVVLAFASVCEANALTNDQLKSLQSSIREMCVQPDRIGDVLKVEGNANVGADLIFKIGSANLEGKMSYEKWNGISVEVDKYKTDPRQCAIEMLKILLPAFSENTIKQENFLAGCVESSFSALQSPFPLPMEQLVRDQDALSLTLLNATDVGSIGCAEAAIKAGAPANGAAPITATGSKSMTPLHQAIQRSNFQMAKLLLDSGADPNLRSLDSPPIVSSILFGSNEIAAILIAKGADTNAVDDNNHSALYLAANNCDREMCELLIAKGARKDTVSKLTNESPADVVQRKCSDASLISLF